VRTGLCREAVRLGRLMAELAPRNAEAHGLLALMLQQHAHSSARVSASGELMTLNTQPTPVAELNAAVAFGMAAGPGQGLAWIAKLAVGSPIG